MPAEHLTCPDRDTYPATDFTTYLATDCGKVAARRWKQINCASALDVSKYRQVLHVRFNAAPSPASNDDAETPP